MPAGPTLIGVGYYCAIKLVGYSAAGYFLNTRSSQIDKPSPVIVGLVRTLIGIGFGMSCLGLLAMASLGSHSWVFFTALVPIRIAEWMLLILIFYSKAKWTMRQKLGYVCFGVIWSFVLDVPTFFAVFKLPGGFWVC